MRTFVAVQINSDLQEVLGRLQERLRGHADGVKWVDPRSMHLTLKFAGELAEKNLPQACDLVGRCASASRPFRLTLGGVGAFPSPERPRVLWVGADDESATMADLHGALDRALAKVGVPREARGFQSHLTLGRVRRPRPEAGLGQVLESLGDQDLGEMDVEEIVFMQSELAPSGPVYTPLSRHRLGEGAPST